MKLESAEAIVDFLGNEGIEAEVYEDYSGRGMFGSTTAGVVAGVATEITWAMGRAGIDDSRRVDNMGGDCIDCIVY